MEILKTAWHYVIIFWPIAGILAGAFAALCFGVKIGYKWGKKDAEQWLKTKMWSVIEARLGYPLQFLSASSWDNKGPLRVQGTLDITLPKPQDIEKGFLYGFKFTPDKTQWKPGPCC